MIGVDLVDDTGRTKLTVWRKKDQPLVDGGVDIRFSNVAESWYRGRMSVALTSRSMIARVF